MLGYFNSECRSETLSGTFFVRCMSSDFAGSHAPPSGFGGRFVFVRKSYLCGVASEVFPCAAVVLTEPRN